MKDTYLRSKSIKLKPDTFAYFEKLVERENKSFSILVEEMLEERRKNERK